MKKIYTEKEMINVHTRRRILCLVMAFLLAFSGVQVALADDEDNVAAGDIAATKEKNADADVPTAEEEIINSQLLEVEYLWDDSFENLKIGNVTAVSGVSLVPNEGNSLSIVETDGMRSLQLNSKGAKEMYIEKALSETLADKAIIDMRVRLDDYGNSVKSIYVRGSTKNYYQVCRFLGSALVMPDGVAVGGLLEDKFYNVALVFDFKAQTIDAYLDGRLRAKDCPFPNAELTQMSRIRFHIAAGIDETDVSIDRIRAYAGDTPVNDLSASAPTSMSDSLAGTTALNITEDDVITVMQNAVAMYANRPKAMLGGKATYISDDRTVMPYWVGENTMVPVRFLVENLGGVVKAEGDSVTASLAGKSVTMRFGEAAMTVNGTSVVMGTPAVLKNGTGYVPLYELCDALDFYLFCEAGVIIASREDMGLSWIDHLALLRKICYYYIYDDHTGADVIDLLKKKWPNHGHPRLIMTQDRVEMIRAEVEKGLEGGGDEFLCKIYEQNKQAADSMLKGVPYTFEGDSGTASLFTVPNTSNEETRLQTLAIVYLISGEEKYAERCLQEMTAIASWWNWNPQDALYFGRMVSAYALAYDWIYNYLSPQDKEFLTTALTEKGLKPYYDNFAGNTYANNVRLPNDSYSRMWNWWGGVAADGFVSPPASTINNFRAAAGAGGYMAALAVADKLEGEQREWAEMVFEGNFVSMKEFLALFAPHGAYEEGTSYFGFASQYLLKQDFSMLTALGTDFGLGESPGLRETNLWYMSMMGPVANFCYHDASRGTVSNYDPSIVGWAARFEKWGEAGPRLSAAGTIYSRVRDLLYYVPKMANLSADEMSLDGIFESTGLFTARNSWDREAIWLGFHSDNAIEKVDHDHMDGGMFVLQAMGEEFFHDVGNDSYSIGDYRRSAYVTVAEGHNTIVLNPNSGKYNGWTMQYGGKATLDKTHSEAGGAYAISNLTDLWREDAESAWRGVKLDNNRKTVTIQDEIKLKEVGEAYWFAHTEAKVTISEDGKTVYLDKNGKVMIGEIIHGDNAKFTVTPAGHLPESPKPSGQKSLKGISRLTIHMENIKEQNLMVTFNCYDDTYDPNGFSKEWVPLSEWKVN